MAATCSSVLRLFSTPTSPNDPIEAKQFTLALLNRRYRKKYDFEPINLSELQSTKMVKRKRLFGSRIPNCSNPFVDSRDVDTSLEEDWLLKTKGHEVALLLNGRSAFLVGMMGCGKTTVGRILAEAVGYSFVDSDRYVEEANGGTTVKEIFEKMGESAFREYETVALERLSLIPQQVVATGGGAVIRSSNWGYMEQGLTVFLDVPLDVLAKRLVASKDAGERPLLRLKSENPYDEAFATLCTLMKERGEAYARAKIRVSLQHLAAELGLRDAYDIPANTTAVQVLEQIQEYLRGQNSEVIAS